MCSGDAGCLQLSIKSGIHDEELWQEKKSLISVGKTIVESCPVNNKHYGVIMVLMESQRMLSTDRRFRFVINFKIRGGLTSKNISATS